MRTITFTEEQKKEIIDMYQNGATQAEIGKKYSVSEDIIRKYLKLWNIQKPMFHNMYSEEDKIKICNLYQNSEWDTIYKLYPKITKAQVYNLASKRGVHKEKYFWNPKDIEFLKMNYKKMSYKEIQKHLLDYHSRGSISGKAIKLGLTQPKDWSNEELGILKKYYSVLPIGEVEKLLPKRTHNEVIYMTGKKILKKLVITNVY